MEIAIINGFPFHYEMFGYLINFCRNYKHKLTIHTNIYNEQGYLLFFKHLFSDYEFEIKDMYSFDILKYKYDKIILATDDDPNFNLMDNIINSKTISIVHIEKNRCPYVKKAISVRPVANEDLKDHCLPVYEIFNSFSKKNSIVHDCINITILGGSYCNYEVNIINRIKSNKKIILHAISRCMIPEKFKGLSDRFQLNIYRNIHIIDLIKMLGMSSYILTDITNNKDYENTTMSGAIPMSFNTLTPLIMSKQTNRYYKFNNVIEFDKTSNEDINLVDINIYLLEQERANIISKNNCILKKYCEDLPG